MRPLPAGMAANISNPYQSPSLSVTAQDLVGTRFSALGSANPGGAGRTATLVTSAGTVIRAAITQIADPNFINVQRIADATQGSQWQAAYTTLAQTARASAGCALNQDSGGGIHLFYQASADNKVYYYQSTDDGQTWSGPTVIGANGLPLGIGNFCYGLAADAGDNVWGIFASYDPYGACILARSSWNGSAWSAWSNEGPSSPSWGLMRGLSAVSNGSVTDFACGVQTRAGLNGIAAGTFYRTATPSYSAISTPIPFDTPNLGLSYSNPSLKLASGTWWMTATLSDDGSISGTAQSRTVVLTSTDFVNWSQYAALGNSFSYGAQVVPHPNGHVYLCDAKYCYTPSATPAATDLSDDVLSIAITDHLDDPADITLVLDNSSAQYNANTNLRSDGTLSIALGYSGQTVTTHVGIIDTVTHQVTPESSTLVITARSHPKLLDYPSSRYLALSGQTVGQIASKLCALAGATLDPLPTTSQFSQLVPCFVITPGETWLSALKRLAAIYGFNFFGTGTPSIRIVEPQTTDPSGWSYSSEILAISYGQSSDQANIIRVVGANAAGSPTPFAEALDSTNLLSVGRERYKHVVDRMLDTSAKCQIRASLELRLEQRQASHGELICMLNPQHELLDVISITDATAGLSSAPLRIESISWRVDLESGAYDQDIHLSGV